MFGGLDLLEHRRQIARTRFGAGGAVGVRREFEQDIERRGAAELLIDQCQTLMDLGIFVELRHKAVLDFELARAEHR